MKILASFLLILQIQAGNRRDDRCYVQGQNVRPILRGNIQFHGSEKISMSTCRNFCKNQRYA